jgi:hypothetical protein
VRRACWSSAAVPGSWRSTPLPGAGGSLLLVNWGGQDTEGIYEADSCDPPRFFSLYDDASLNALEFEGFEVLRRELLTEHAAQGLHPQLLVLRRRESPSSPG